MTVFIRSLPDREYSREDLLVAELELAEEPAEGLVVYDAPLGWVNPRARVVLIGVTPGFTQMQIVYRAVRRHLLAGMSPEDACRLAKYEASFGGSMRGNLVRMLDDLGVHEFLGVSSTADLFGSASHLLHTTSAVRYPTFLGSRNYTGNRPPITRSAFLMRYAREVLAPELSLLQAALFVPLGKSVAAVLELLETERRIPAGRALYGFPHPSGANGHRMRQFKEAKPRLRQCLKAVLIASVLGRCPTTTCS
ncbi:MAG: uracil-DNA glycosylase family protein [Gemmatimonadaceae bacterium]